MPAKIDLTHAQLTEITMAQDFQDLTGQVIKKIVSLAQTLESGLMNVLIDIVPETKRTEEVNSLMNGPVVNAERSTDVVVNQEQMEDLLQDFLQEAHAVLSDVDNKLVDLERTPDDRGLLNDIFRGFHTVKGGAGFLNASELVTLCHLTENLFDRLRNGEIELTREIMDVIMAATKGVRDMFGELGQMVQPQPAAPEVIAALQGALSGEAPVVAVVSPLSPEPVSQEGVESGMLEPYWVKLNSAVTGDVSKDSASSELITKAEASAIEAAVSPIVSTPVPSAVQSTSTSAFGRRATDRPGGQPTSARRAEERVRENTIRVDTSRLDQVLNLSGEIGLTKNRMTSLRADVLAGKNDGETLHALDQAVSQLDLLVSDLQNSVMKTRMQQ